MTISKRDIANLKARIRRQTRGFGGRDTEADRRANTWIWFAIDEWAKSLAKRGDLRRLVPSARVVRR